MAPVFSASRLLELCLLFAILFSQCYPDAFALLTYDCLTLLNLQPLTHQTSGFKWQPGNFVSTQTDISDHLRHFPATLPPRKHQRRRGKRGGIRVRLKAYLHSLDASSYHVFINTLSSFHVLWGCFCYRLPCHCWISPVGHCAHLDSPAECPPVRSWVRLSRGGVNYNNLRLLRSVPAFNNLTILWMALLNVRSLANKTFILNDFFLSSGLDFLYLKPGFVLRNLLLFQNFFPQVVPMLAPLRSLTGGGLSSIFKHKFRCRELPPVFDTSFEVQLLELNCAPPILCAVVYQPPKSVKDSIFQFGDLLGSLVLRYDRVLIVGDFKHTNKGFPCPY